MTKYQKYYQLMLGENKETFEYFKKLHNSYVEEPEFWQAKFNDEGKKVIEIIREWERRLCRNSERGQFGKFSSNLAEKFWDQVRIHFPKIDFVGVKI